MSSEICEKLEVKYLKDISDRLSEISTSFEDFLKFINSDKIESLVPLPKDCYGEIWRGSESRYIDKDSPMENKKFMDGLLWNGKEWFIFSQSADGKNWGLFECAKAKHYKSEEIR